MPEELREESMQETLANSYLSSFCLEVSLILKAGIIISEGISMLAADEKYPPVKSSLLKISADMESGNSITASMRSSNLFPKYMLDMVAIGEKTGQLEKVFKSLSEYYNRQVQITQMIRDAVLYPLILLLMMLFVIILLVTQVFPIFADVYAQIGTVLPPTAVMLMNVGNWLKEYWPFVLGGLAVLVAVSIFLLRKLGWRLFSTGKLGRKIAQARFSSAMALAMNSGLNDDEALQMAEKLIGNKNSSQKITECRQKIQNGKKFTDAIMETGILTPLFSRMLSIGFKTGVADNVMSEIANRSEDMVNSEINALINKVEPTLVIIMSVLVGMILITVMLPLTGIMSTIG